MTEPRTRAAANAAAANGAEGLDLTVLQRLQELLMQPAPARVQERERERR